MQTFAGVKNIIFYFLHILPYNCKSTKIRNSSFFPFGTLHGQSNTIFFSLKKLNSG